MFKYLLFSLVSISVLSAASLYAHAYVGSEFGRDFTSVQTGEQQ